MATLIENISMFDEDLTRAAERLLDATYIAPDRDPAYLVDALGRFGRQVPIEYVAEAQRRRAMRGATA